MGTLIPHVVVRLPENHTHENESELSSRSHCSPGSLTGPLGLFVQFLLAFIAFTCLIVKRFCEPEYQRRPWKIWFFDTSKQAVGAAVIHFANLFIAAVFHGDPCTWYIISFLLDSTLGLLVIYIGLRISQVIVMRKDYQSFVFGEYGNPPQLRSWLGQCCLYILVMLVEKMIMTLLLLFDFWKRVRDFIMYPIKSPEVELIIVMFLVPLVVNPMQASECLPIETVPMTSTLPWKMKIQYQLTLQAVIFWVVDNFLMKKQWKVSHGPINSNESAMKYFRAIDRVKYYKETEHADDSESDVLLSLDEDVEMKYRGVTNEKPRTEQHSLLRPNIT